jgi:HD superfamily phosphohydrolase
MCIKYKMSDATPQINPQKAFINEKSEKLDTIDNEIKTLRKDINKLRTQDADSTAIKAVSDLISTKRTDYKTLRDSHYTPTQ